MSAACTRSREFGWHVAFYSLVAPHVPPGSGTPRPHCTAAEPCRTHGLAIKKANVRAKGNMSKCGRKWGFGAGLCEAMCRLLALSSFLSEMWQTVRLGAKGLCLPRQGGYRAAHLYHHLRRVARLEDPRGRAEDAFYVKQNWGEVALCSWRFGRKLGDLPWPPSSGTQ